MSDSAKKWIIRDTAGRITGPFTTEKILYMIGRGEFNGEESVALYPGGAWIPISQEPQFYDKLLDALAEAEYRMPEDGSKSEQNQRADHTEIFHEEPRPKKVEVENTPPPAAEAFPEPPEPQHHRKKKRKKKRKKAEDIELVDVRGEYIREVLRRGLFPIAVGVAGIFTLWLGLGGSPSSSERIHLLPPQKNQSPAGLQAIQGYEEKAAADFIKDTFEGYIGAETGFVRAVESNAKDPEVMSFLCMTYLELWPYAYQDSSDLKTVAGLMQLSTVIDPGGIHSSACRSVDLIVRGRYSEAKSLVESMLESRANEASEPIIFYYLKGLLLSETGDNATAVGYLRKAEELWPVWTLPYVAEANAEIKMEKYNEAASILRRILASNDRHAVSKIELGLIEYKYFNHLDTGQELLNEGLSESAPKETMSRGYFGLAEIALKNGNQSRALSYAQKAYSLNSTNNLAKNLIVRIGGVETLRGTKVKGQQLVLEGDQFFREGDCHAAQAHYKAAFEEDNHNAVAAMKAAQCLWRLSFSTEAIDWLNRAIKADPKLIEAYVLMADYHTQRYNFLAASKILAAAYQINKKSPDVFRGYALVELRRGNPQGAITWGKKALQLYENDTETQILMAQAYIAANDYRLAYNYAAKAIELDVNHRKAQTVYAEALMGLQGVDVAIDYLLKLIASYPLVIDYRLALGKLYEKDERFDEAEETFKQIAKIEDKPKEAYIELSKVLKAENRLNEALEYLLKAAVLDPADAEPLFQAGLIYLDTRKALEATAQFQRVLKINKLFPLVHYHMGRAYLLMNQPEQTLDETRQEKTINPNLADAFLLAADAYSAMKQYHLCATEYQKAIKLRPQGAPIYVKLAQCYRKSGNIDAAVDMLTHAASLEQGFADIYKEQGAIYEFKGEIEHAIEAYNQYFVLDPNAPDRAQIEQRILSLQRGAITPE